MDRPDRPTPEDAPRFIAHLAPAIQWLRDRGVPATRIAGALRVAPERVRQLDHRRPRASGVWTPPDVGRPLSLRTRQLLGIRADADRSEPSPNQARRAAGLRHEIATIREQYATAYRFAEGIDALRATSRRLGYPGQTALLRAAAAAHQAIAWFAVHSGRSHTACAEASLAVHLAHAAYRQSANVDDLRAMMEVALIGSLACLLTRRPDDALQWLELYEALSEPAHAPLGSEFFRQRGTAMFQQLDVSIDAAARRQFDRAARVMEDRGEVAHAVQLLMTGPRQKLLLERFDDGAAQQLLGAVRRAYPAGALESVMAAHWTAAGALATDSPTMHQIAVADVMAAASHALAFGHQASISYLLQSTPDLALDDPTRRLWVRFLLYTNAFRDE